MLEPSQALAFLAAALVLTATPGPDNLMVLGMGMSRGRRAGVAFGLGCALGCLSHTLLAVVGVSALVAASPLAFGLLKAVGGAYLVWMGVQAWRHAGRVAPGSATGAARWLTRLFGQGLVANAINPKVVLFFLAFLPQFVQPAQGPVPLQLGLLGLLFTAQAALLFGALGWFSGSVGAWLNRRPAVGPWLDRLAGTVFVGLGLRMLLTR